MPTTSGSSESAVEARRRLAGLLQRAAAGSQDAFAEAHAATARKLRSVIVEVLGEGADADDVLQEAYLRIWRSAPRFDPRVSSPMTWMIVVARNVAIDRFRRRKPATLPIGEEALTVSTAPVDPFEDHDRAIEMRSALAAMRTLAPERAELLSRAYLQGQSRAELARAYGAPASTIKTWIRRSLVELRERLESEMVERSVVRGRA